MKPMMTVLALLGALTLATPATAACFVEYKAKQDDPLRLHYGILEISTTSCPGNAQALAAARLQNGGWTLLTVLGLSTDTPSAQQRANAGENYLRF